jgi:adenylylsulfate kinase-like enzyme
MVIVVTGPIASGKSSVARELALGLAGPDVPAEVIDLDAVHDQLVIGGSASGDTAWTLARRSVARTANSLMREGATVVIAEGSFNLPADRAILREGLDEATEPVYVTLRVSFDEALRRAQGDPTRGRSRDPEFLRSHFAARRDVLANAPASDIVIDTEGTTAAAIAAAIARLVRASAT